jgi:extracellular factor (EF) 3-hydroxypalmitic acid methyl ester biosynthesis protein
MHQFNRYAGEEHQTGGEIFSGEATNWRVSHVAGLNQAHARLLGGDIPQGMQTLFSALQHTRATLLPEDWKGFCRDLCLRHPIRELVHQEFFTRRSFDKPRGYAGDAVLLDYLYQGLHSQQESPTPLGQGIYQYLSQQTSTRSLLGRRNLLAQWIDDTAQRCPEPRILSVACGHLREAHLSRAVQERRLGKFLALDQDVESLAVVGREFGNLGVEKVPGSVKALLKGELRFDGMDFIYASGLYDYLPQPVAIRLSRILFSMLRPGGRLLLANYSDPAPDSSFKAYMEAFMDWWLLYRDEAEVREWSQDIPRAELAGQKLFRDDTGNLVYLALTRR